MATMLEQFVYGIGVEVNKSQMAAAQQKIDKFSQGISSVANKANFASAAFLGFASVVNKSVTENVNLAKSVGQNVDVMQALGQESAKIGLEFENIIDLAEEMNNKIGESSGLGEQITPVKEALQIMGLQFENIEKLAPAEQFEAITNALLNMNDAQKASSAADILLGGEASKLIGFLQAQGKSLDEIMKSYQALNYETDESREGAIKYTESVSKLWKILTSLGKYISGIFGESFYQLIDQFSLLIEANKELIQLNIAETLKTVKTIIVQLWGVLKILIDGVIWLSEQVGGFGNLMKIVFGAMIISKIWGLVGALVAVGGALTASAVGAAVLKAALIGIKLGAALLFLQDLYVWSQGGDSVFGMLFGDVDEVFNNVLTKFDVVGGAFKKLWDGITNLDSSMILNSLNTISKAIIQLILAPFDLVVSAINRITGKNIPTVSGLLGADFNESDTKLTDQLNAEGRADINRNTPQYRALQAEAAAQNLEYGNNLFGEGTLTPQYRAGQAQEAVQSLEYGNNLLGTGMLSPLAQSSGGGSTTNNQDIKIDVTTSDPAHAAQLVASEINVAKQNYSGVLR